MKAFALSIITGCLLTTAGMPAHAQQTAPAAATADASAPTSRKPYMDRAADDMHAWGERFHALGDTVKASGKNDDLAAKHGLQRAWDNTRAAARRLTAASKRTSEDGWQNAKASYQKAAQTLGDAWKNSRFAKL